MRWSPLTAVLRTSKLCVKPSYRVRVVFLCGMCEAESSGVNLSVKRLETLDAHCMQVSMSGISVSEDAVNLFYYMKAKSTVRRPLDPSLACAYPSALVQLVRQSPKILLALGF